MPLGYRPARRSASPYSHYTGTSALPFRRGRCPHRPVPCPPVGDGLPYISVGRGPCAPPGAMRALRRVTWVPPYKLRRSHRADRVVRPYSAKRCHSEPVRAAEQVPSGYSSEGQGWPISTLSAGLYLIWLMNCSRPRRSSAEACCPSPASMSEVNRSSRSRQRAVPVT